MDADHCAHVAAFYQGQFDRLWSQYDEANFDALERNEAAVAEYANACGAGSTSDFMEDPEKDL